MNERGFRRGRVLLVLAGFLCAAVASTSSAAAVAQSHERARPATSGLVATARISGVQVPIAVGSTVGQGRFDGQQCQFSPAVSVSAAEGVEVVVSVNDSCTAVVTGMTQSTAPSVRPESVVTGVQPALATGTSPTTRQVSPLAVVNHYMWAKNTVQEQFGITSFEVYVEMKYTRNGGSVYNGNSPGYRDYNSIAPCWTVTNEAYNWDPTGPTSVFIYRRTRFSSCLPPHPDAAISARATADPLPRHTCNTPAVPKFWDLRCNGGKYY